MCASERAQLVAYDFVDDVMLHWDCFSRSDAQVIDFMRNLWPADAFLPNRDYALAYLERCHPTGERPDRARPHRNPPPLVPRRLTAYPFTTPPSSDILGAPAANAARERMKQCQRQVTSWQSTREPQGRPPSPWTILARSIGQAYKEITQIYPQPGWVEHDPLELVDSCEATVAELLASAGIQPL